jgi:hypothetical protein
MGLLVVASPGLKKSTSADAAVKPLLIAMSPLTDHASGKVLAMHDRHGRHTRLSEIDALTNVHLKHYSEPLPVPGISTSINS